MQNQLKIGRNTVVRYFLNGAFLMVLSYLLIFNPSFDPPPPSSAETISQAITTDIGPDSLITFIRTSKMSVGEIRQVLDFLETEHLMESEQGQATCYALSKQVQQKIDAGSRSKTLRNIIDQLASHQMIVEIPKSDWSKLFTYTNECVFEDLHCDHLYNRVTRHPYFKGLIILLCLIVLGGAYLTFRRFSTKKRINLKMITE